MKIQGWKINFMKKLCFLLCFQIFSIYSHAQEQKFSLKDTLDNRFDCSHYLVNMKGFVPLPLIITEPALGNFGGALALIFISPHKNVKDSSRFRFPDITGIAGLYTLNDSWGVFGFRQGSFPSLGMRYTAAVAYPSLNINFYREVPAGEEKEFEFNLTPAFVLADVSKNIFKNKIFGGIRYLIANVKVSRNFAFEVDSIFDKRDYNENIGTFGIYGEYENRNSIFTPDRGFRIKSVYSVSRDWTGSNFDFEKYEVFAHAFFQPGRRWVIGLRAESQGVNDGAPFYSFPFILMRGIPVMRYQGNATLLFETENRYDLNLRWSLVGFAGAGRTFSDSEFLKDDDWHWSGGAGFRYLLARVFKLRVGIDVATGPDQFAYYIVFGHYWTR
jgi:hypothetical protein